MPATIIQGSSSLVGYDVELFEKDDFEVMGFSALHQPDTPDFDLWQKLRDDGRLDQLIQLADHKEVFGCSSGAGEAAAGLPEGTYRHTVCIEVPPGADAGSLSSDGLFRLRFPASKWVCFNLTKERFYDGQRYLLWENDPYGMVKRLGFHFNWGIAVHMDVFDRPDTGIFNIHDPVDRQKIMHFWMPVT